MMTRPGALGITSKDNCPSVFPSFRRRCSFAPSMALALTPRLLRRGLELFALISLAGVGGLLFYGNNFQAFAQALFSLHWGWLVVGLGLASMDWIGGGGGPWGVGRPRGPRGRPRGMNLSGGVGAGGAHLTPVHTRAGPPLMGGDARRGGGA